jgi:hypothetical protein
VKEDAQVRGFRILEVVECLVEIIKFGQLPIHEIDVVERIKCCSVGEFFLGMKAHRNNDRGP